LVASDWQRIDSVEEYYDKLPQVESKFPEIEDYYLKNTMKPREWYYERFEQRMNELLK
jgi:hypothetical protein